MTEVLHDLHWLPVASRIKYKLLIVTFKALRTGTMTMTMTMNIILFNINIYNGVCNQNWTT